MFYFFIVRVCSFLVTCQLYLKQAQVSETMKLTSKPQDILESSYGRVYRETFHPALVVKLAHRLFIRQEKC